MNIRMGKGPFHWFTIHAQHSDKLLEPITEGVSWVNVMEVHRVENNREGARVKAAECSYIGVSMYSLYVKRLQSYGRYGGSTVREIRSYSRIRSYMQGIIYTDQLSTPIRKVTGDPAECTGVMDGIDSRRIFKLIRIYQASCCHKLWPAANSKDSCT